MEGVMDGGREEENDGGSGGRKNREKIRLEL